MPRSTGAERSGIESDLVGLDSRPRPASTRERIIQGLKQSAPFSSLQRRIIVFNLLGLALLVLGVLYLNQFRSGLIQQRAEALLTQAEMIAVTIAETAAIGPDDSAYDPVRANIVLNRLAQPTGLRARLYDSRLRLTGDTRNIGISGGPVERIPLDPPAPEGESNLMADLQTAYNRIAALLGEGKPVYSEVPTLGISRDPEVREAARGRIGQAVRVNAQDELIVSVAVPVRRFKRVLGVLVLSTEGGAINEIVSDERKMILQVFILASLVSVGLSVLLANTIARPIRRLAEAAEGEGTSAARPLSPDRVEIPDMTRRSDEIGELSAALIRMTKALYGRIEAIESFASDVAHEIKNPLTSLRSAVETMQYAKTPEQRQRLLDVIQNDVSRMDRLVTDISNASRLDAELVREKMRSFDLAALIRMLVSVTEHQGEARQISVDARLPEGGLTALGLEGRIAQVITNLLDNALSFSPDGGRITVEGKRVDGRVRVSVADQGPGVPPDSINTVFQRFYSERPEREAFGDHSGLGLSIAHQIVEAHGGSIWVENIPDTANLRGGAPLGARFVIELPA